MQLTVQLQQGVKHRRQVGQVGPQILSGAMEQVLQVADQGEHREDRLNQSPLIPFPLGAELKILWNSRSRGEAPICQGDRLPFKRSDHGQEDLIVDVGRVPVPSDHFPSAVDEPAEFDPHDPAVVGLPLLAELLGAAPFTPGMDQFDAVGVDHGEEGGIGEEEVTQILVGGQEALEPGPFRQREPLRVIPAQPAVEGAKGAAFEDKEEADGDQLARVELSLKMFGEVTDPIRSWCLPGRRGR